MGGLLHLCFTFKFFFSIKSSSGTWIHLVHGLSAFSLEAGAQVSPQSFCRSSQSNSDWRVILQAMGFGPLFTCTNAQTHTVA